jgi:TnpA family transposase
VLERRNYPVGVDAPEARAVSRYFGRGRGVTFYVWTSDQHTHYATRVVRTTVRDAVAAASVYKQLLATATGS